MLLTFTRTGQMPLGKIGQRLQVHPASVTNVIDRLEVDGLVRRRPHPTDQRTTLAAITAKGRRRRRGGHRRAQRRGLRRRRPAARPARRAVRRAHRPAPRRRRLRDRAGAVVDVDAGRSSTRLSAGGQDELHENEVEPAAELQADLGQAADLDEAEALVEAHRRLVLPVDRGDHRVHAPGRGRARSARRARGGRRRRPSASGARGWCARPCTGSRATCRRRGSRRTRRSRGPHRHRRRRRRPRARGSPARSDAGTTPGAARRSAPPRSRRSSWCRTGRCRSPGRRPCRRRWRRAPARRQRLPRAIRPTSSSSSTSSSPSTPDVDDHVAQRTAGGRTACLTNAATRS